tara:strand:- start:1568 stop:2143 length:576 start_codon:yes stop_codon:yes gene_type:complete
MGVLIFFLWILTGIVTGVVASDKGHGFGSWIFAGLMLGPFGLIAAAGLSDQKLREYIRRTIDPQSSWPIESKQKLFGGTLRPVDSSPKLLNESQSSLTYKTEEYSKENNIGNFLLNKNASEGQIWSKVIEILEFTKPEIVSLADPSESKIKESLTGGKIYMICQSDGKKIALAYAKESSQNNNLYWQIRMY